jgi:5-methylcytosine-specific restriction endonuclease McrA
VKTCSKCKIEKDDPNFYPLKSGKLSSWCRECNRGTTSRWKKSPQGKAADRRYLNTEKGKAARAKRLKSEGRKAEKARYGKSDKGKAAARRTYLRQMSTEEGRQKRREANQKWHSTPKGQARAKAYRARPGAAEYQRLAGRKYNQTEKGKECNRRSTQARRARLLETECNFTAADWEEIKRLHKGKCHWCKRKRVLTMDHVIPLAKGGTHTPENIVAACQPCNSRKRDRLLTLL